MPVSQGSVKGTVRVVKSLEDASAIQVGFHSSNFTLIPNKQTK